VRVDHAPGTLFSELDPARPGESIISARESNGAVHEVARCTSYEAPLLVLSRHVPHECDHEQCPGPASARQLDRLVPLRAAAVGHVEIFGRLRYAAIAEAIGEERAQRLWESFAALQAALAE